MEGLELTVPAKSAALGRLREQNMEISAPFAQKVLIVEHARIAGTSHHGDNEEVLMGLEIDSELTLLREPSSRYDPWSIRILTSAGRMLGYMPADVNEILARLMDAGKRLFAKVSDKDSSDTWTKVYMDVFLDD